MPPVLPMLAKATKSWDEFERLTTTRSSQYEPKWDGFRCVVFKDEDEVELASRNGKPLTRYFPDVVEALREQAPARCVLDGEVVVARDGRLEFEMLQERVHPAASRVNRLAVETPADYVAFDLLALGDRSFMQAPFADRRRALTESLAGISGRVHLTRTTTDPEVARQWFSHFEGAGLDGVVGKALDSVYTPNQRTMAKVKHARTADVVIGGYRLHKTSSDARPLLGSLLLGLYDEDGHLQHVGVCATFTEKVRAEMIGTLAPLVVPMDQHPWGEWPEIIANPDRVPGTQSRWSQGKDLSFVPLRPALVAEVGYDHLEGRRFRHTTQFKRWRTDRDPESCGYDQLEEVVSYHLGDVWAEDRV